MHGLRRAQDRPLRRDKVSRPRGEHEEAVFALLLVRGCTRLANPAVWVQRSHALAVAAPRYRGGGDSSLAESTFEFLGNGSRWGEVAASSNGKQPRLTGGTGGRSALVSSFPKSAVSRRRSSCTVAAWTVAKSFSINANDATGTQIAKLRPAMKPNYEFVPFIFKQSLERVKPKGRCAQRYMICTKRGGNPARTINQAATSSLKRLRANPRRQRPLICCS